MKGITRLGKWLENDAYNISYILIEELRKYENAFLKESLLDINADTAIKNILNEETLKMAKILLKKEII